MLSFQTKNKWNILYDRRVAWMEEFRSIAGASIQVWLTNISLESTYFFRMQGRALGVVYIPSQNIGKLSLNMFK